MYKQYDATHNRTLSVEEFCAKNIVKLESKPLVAVLTFMIPSLRNELEAVHKQRTKNTSVISSVKHSDKKRLAYFLFYFNQMFFNFYIKTEEHEKRKAFTHSASCYIHGADGILFNEASQRIVDCENMGESLDKVGITAENLTELKNETATYKKIIQRPQGIRNENKNLKGKEDALIKKLNDIFDLSLNKLMSSAFEKSDPELLAAYKLAAKKENYGTQKPAMKSVIQNKETVEMDFFMEPEFF